MTLSDVNSVDFNVRQLVKIEPRVQQLVSVLNQFGQNQMGAALTLGTLRVHTEPQVTYMAPVHAYGVTPRWTVAVGVPIVKYNNRLSLSQTGSNVAEIRRQTGGLSQDIDDAFKQLDVSLVASAQKELEQKGYKPLSDRSETIVGDVQLASLYQVYATPRQAVMWKSILSLPTGPSDDPDDLADLNIFGTTSLDQVGVYNYSILPHVRLGAKATFRYNFPDHLVRRVPTTEDDTLPGPETKENLRRKTGDTVQLDGSVTFDFLKNWSVSAGYEIAQKGADSYEGDRGGRYEILSRDTYSEAQRTRIGVGYDSTKAYFAKEAMLPSLISYEFTDTIRGINIERQTIHELWITLFF